MADAIMNCPLPEDLITAILVRLPVKSLLQFMSVCKEWHAIITSLSFISEHSHHESNHSHFLLLYLCREPYESRPGPDDTFALLSDKILKELKVDCVNLLGEIDAIVGPCMNGVFCVLNKRKKLALWNPSTRRLAPLPDPPETLYEFAEIGFGINPSSKEFKIVLIYAKNNCFVNEFALYTSGNDTWRYSEYETLLDSDAYVSTYNFGVTFVNGFYYWLRKSIRNCNHVMLAFDMHKEVFQEIEMPKLDAKKYQELYLCLYKDSLVLVSCDWKTVDDKCIEIWLMKEQNCWTKLYSMLPPFKLFVPLGFCKDNKIFLFTQSQQPQSQLHGCGLTMYGLNSHGIKTVFFPNGEKPNCEMWPLSFKESLVSVKYKPGIQDYDIESPVYSEFFPYKKIRHY